MRRVYGFTHVMWGGGGGGADDKLKLELSLPHAFIRLEGGGGGC